MNIFMEGLENQISSEKVLIFDLIHLGKLSEHVS